MLARCIIGYEGILDEGEFYTIKDVTSNGNIKLYEIDPPEPYTSFKSERFQFFIEDGNIPEELTIV